MNRPPLSLTKRIWIALAIFPGVYILGPLILDLFAPFVGPSGRLVLGLLDGFISQFSLLGEVAYLASWYFATHPAQTSSIARPSPGRPYRHRPAYTFFLSFSLVFFWIVLTIIGLAGIAGDSPLSGGDYLVLGIVFALLVLMLAALVVRRDRPRLSYWLAGAGWSGMAILLISIIAIIRLS